MTTFNREQALEFKGKGNTEFSAGNYQQAIEYFTKAIENDQNDHVFFSNRSACYANLDQFEPALEDAEKCISLKPDWSKGYSRKGLALFRMGRLPEAQETYESGLQFDAQNPLLLEGLETVKNQMANPPNPLGQLFGPDIWGKIQTNPKLAPYLDDPQFVQNVNQLQKNPASITSLLGDEKIKHLFGALIGIDLDSMPSPSSGDQDSFPMDAESFPEVPQQQQQSAPEQPRQPEPTPREPEKPQTTPEEDESDQEKQLGNTAYKAKNFSKAIEHYQRALELNPLNATIFTNLSAVFFEQKDFSRCIEECQKAVELSHSHGIDLKILAKAYARMGNAQLKLGNVEMAMEMMEKSLLEVYDRKIDIQLKQLAKDKKEKDAASYLSEEKALEHKAKGNEHYQEGKWVDAISEYSESLRRNPEDHKVYSNRSACFVKLMEWSKALEDADKALQICPTFVKAYLRKAKIQHFLKQYHKAIETYKIGLELCPGSDELRQGMMETRMAIAAENSSGQIDPDRQKRAMEDPDVQRILQDPQMQSIMQTMSQDPAAASKFMADPAIRANLEVLVNAGVIQMR